MAQESRLVIVIDSQNAERNARNLGNELNSIERKGEFASKSMDSLSVATRALAGHMAGLLTVGSAISKMDTYTGLQNRLKLVTNNQAELNKATEDTFRIAQKTYSAWDSVLQVYQRFSDNAETLNLTMDDTARLTETVSKAVAISGASAEAADAALVQFGQALASGTLRGEELNSVMEQTPALAKAIAKGMGITVGELRSVAAEGKITSQEIVKALRNVESDVDALFAKTDITIGQSLTLLNNEIIKFVGEAGKGSGAAQVLAGSVQTLASNLDLIADGALVVGIGYITRAILMKSAAVKEGMASTLASRQASVLNAQAEYAEATATLNAAKAHLANVRATNAETQAKFGATAAATRYAQAQAAVTAATNAQTAAQTRLSAASSLVGSIGSRALGLIGGPIGAITLGVSALAATYTYFKGKAEEANRTLAEQAEVANRTAEELKGLKGEAKTKAINDLTTAFKAQNEELKKTEMAVGSALIDIQNFGKGNVELTRISNEARLGTISYKEAMEQLAKQKLPPSLRDALKEQIDKYNEAYEKADKTKTAIKLFGIEVTLTGNKAQNAAIEQQKHADAIKNTKQAADEAQKSLQKLYADKLWDTQFVEIVMKKGFSESQANDLLKLYKDSLAKGLKAADQEALKSLVDTWKAEESIKAITDARTDSIREQNKALKKQGVLLAGNDEKLRNMLRVYQAFRNAGLGDKQARVMTAQVGRETDFRNEAMFGSHKDANNGYTNTGFLSWQKSRSTKLMQSLQGQGVLDKNGKIQQTQDALDAMARHAVQEAMTDKSYSKSKAALLNDDLDYRSLERIVAKNFVGWDYDGKKLGKAKASQHLAKQDSYYNQLSKILGDNPEAASKAIGDLSKFEDEAYKARAKTLEEVKQLQATYDSETVARSKRREEEINKATILGQSNLIPKINERFDAEEKLAQKQFDFEVNGYKWTEEQKLDYTYETNSLRLVAEGKLSEDQRKVALDGLELQKQQELELIELAREKQLLEAKSSYMGETELAVRRYQAELKEIEKVRDAKLKAGLLSANNMGQFQTLDSASDKVFQSGFNASQQVFQQNDPREYAQWDLQNRYSTDAGGLLNTYIDQINGINLIADEEQRNSQLLAAREQYLQSRKALDEKYAQDERDLNSSLFETQLGQLSSLTSQLSGYWSNMTGIVKNAAGEQSGIYKGMYIAQQAFAIGSATISALQAYNQILASPWYLDVISKSTAANLVLGMGMANVGLIAGQTIAGFSDGGYTGNGLKHTPAGIVHKGEVVWSQEDIKRWGGVGLVEKMRKSANPEAFLNNNASADSVMRRAMMSSNAFIESQKQADIFNQPVQDTQIIYKGNRDTPKLASSANSDLFHDGKVYFSSSGLVQDRSNLDDVQDFTMGKAARPQAEIMPSIEPASPIINFKIEVVNQVSGATVEAEQLDEQTVRIIVTDELDKQLPRKVPKLVSDQIANPNSTISRSLTENTTARRNR
ncbi:tape measure protein [Acinetobacter baumannii]|uniref:tape measure protein n=4 Tax=Acinetobacter baumannii TaxID=470 RepID=UPI001CDF0E2D|nr:tape measure protein [Acinetobacter baumannii]UPZ24787.1 tape measure protein [Acinetobacter baumannii]UQX99709.1 tape measure protein [Acinetobacter baumannii]HBJ3905678.1 tape measure protein [Acinetobacter baumannii]HBJ3945270.1 tape measure protein [Acinetobacter baumannii]HBJ4703845.1 tape measure protein [Acinetobacter baumannii]